MRRKTDLAAGFMKTFPQVKRVQSETEILRGFNDSARPQFSGSRRASANRHTGHAARQGLHGRQAGHHDARTTGGRPSSTGADETDLLDHVQRAFREPRDGEGRGARQGRGHRSRRPDHRARPSPHPPPDRPEWFWDKPRYGGILCDIGSHQADQFLYFTGSSRADVVSSQVANVHHHDHPTFEDFGDVTLRGDKGPATSAWTGLRPAAWRRGATAG